MGGTNIFWIPYNWLILLYGSTICMRAKFKKNRKKLQLIQPLRTRTYVGVDILEHTGVREWDVNSCLLP